MDSTGYLRIYSHIQMHIYVCNKIGDKRGYGFEREWGICVGVFGRRKWKDEMV